MAQKRKSNRIVYLYRGLILGRLDAKFILSRSKYARKFIEQHKASQIVQEEGINWNIGVTLDYTATGGWVKESTLVPIDAYIEEVIWTKTEIQFRFMRKMTPKQPSSVARIISISYSLLDHILTNKT